MGGGIAATCIQLSAQASVAHKDVATVTAVVLLITEVGNSVGSAIATAIWTNTMPQALADNVPTTNSTLLAELYGNIASIALVRRLPLVVPDSDMLSTLLTTLSV